jgi:hypothetical protein
MSKRREDVTVMKPRRVQGDPKKKILLGIDKDEHQVAGEQTQRLEVKTRRHDFLPELGAASKVTGASTEVAGEVAAASGVEVAVKEPKQISTESARMFSILAGKRTPDRAAMLHSEFLISPTWRTNCQGVRPAQIRKGATQAVVDSLMGGSGPKSVSGSSWWNSELDENGKDAMVLDWFRPPESKTLRPV